MGVLSSAQVRTTQSCGVAAGTTECADTPATFQKNGAPLFSGGSLFTGGKIADNLGAFVQVTYNNYASQGTSAGGGAGKFLGHSGADNMDFRYADRFIGPSRDLIVGASVNNGPSISDPWNSAAAWMQYVPPSSPTSYQFSDGTAPYPGLGTTGGGAVRATGVTAYAYWNQSVYGEIGAYRTANKAFSFMSTGATDASTVHLAGFSNPYWRFAITHQWRAHNIMVGTSGMVAHVYDLGSDVSDPNNQGRIKNIGVDAQYQYILDPHTVTAQAAYMRTRQNYSANTLAAGARGYFLSDGVTPIAPMNPSDTINVFRAKVSYIYQAKYGGSVGVFNRSSSTNSFFQTAGYDANGQITSTDPTGTGGITSTRVTGNLAGNLGTRGATFELFWQPIQYVRVGVQYTAYSRFNGASSNYDGFGRNPSDNNTLYFYVWGAY